MRVFFSVGLETDPNADELTYVAEEVVQADLSQYRAWIEQYEHGHELGKLTISVDDEPQTESGMNVQANFSISLLEDIHTYISEATLNAQLSSYLPKIAEEYPILGGLTLRTEGQPDIEIHDELWLLIQSVCFQSLPKLRSGQPYTYMYAEFSGEVLFEPIDHQVKVSNLYTGASAFFAHEALFTALYDCGLRFIEFLENFKDDPNYQMLIPHLKEQAALSRL